MANTNKNGKSFTKNLTMVAILTAITVVLQIVALVSRPFLPFSITLSLFPIVIGAALFGITVLLSGDAAAFLTVNIPGTIITVLAKGTLAGLAAGLIYKLASKVNGYFGVFCSAIVAPIVNTGVFLLGCKLFFMDTITSWAEAAGSPNVGSYIILSFVGINFLIELGVNMVCSPIILRLINIRKKEG